MVLYTAIARMGRARGMTAAIVARLVAIRAALEGMIESIRESPSFRYGYEKGLETFEPDPDASVMGATRGMAEKIGGGVVSIGIITLVLNKMFSLKVFNITNGPFSGLIDQVISIGTGALSLVVLGFLAAAGSVAVGMYRSGFR